MKYFWLVKLSCCSSYIVCTVLLSMQKQRLCLSKNNECSLSTPLEVSGSFGQPTCVKVRPLYGSELLGLNLALIPRFSITICHLERPALCAKVHIQQLFLSQYNVRMLVVRVSDIPVVKSVTSTPLEDNVWLSESSAVDLDQIFAAESPTGSLILNSLIMSSLLILLCMLFDGDRNVQSTPQSFTTR